MGDAVPADATHSAMRDALVRWLPMMRKQWERREAQLRAARLGLAKLLREGQAFLSSEADDENGVCGDELECALASLDAVQALLVVPAPDGCRTADDVWIVHASRELDDDEIANALTPAGYRLDREKAIAAMRNRRLQINARRGALRDELIAGMP